MESTTIINLRPSHSLLNPNFDGYKLSLEPVPVLKSPLPSPLRRVFTNEEQYTFLHAKLFSLHNHLFRDSWLPYSCYFVDDNWTIQNVRYDTTTGTLGSVKSVLKLSKPNFGRNDYNPSCSFVSEKYCVFSDGCGALRIIDTGDRFRNEEWKAIHNGTVFENSVPFIVQDARLEIVDNVRHIHCLLLSVQEKLDGGDDDKRYEAIIDWVRFTKETESNAWNKAHVRKLRGKSLPDYCVLETKSNGILLSADQRFEFVFDTEHPLKTTDPSSSSLAPKDNANGELNFTWTQTEEDVIVHFNVSRDSSKNDIKIVCSGSNMHAYHRNVTLLDAELYRAIDKDLTTWNLENELLQVTLVKSEPNMVWTSLLKNITINPSEEPVETIRDLTQPLASSLRTEMEDCDFGDSDIEREYSLVRIDATSHVTTHKANLGQNNKILFTLPLRAGHPPAFALRSDVDVCVWLPFIRPPIDQSASTRSELQLRHEGTLNAFGYIQASKQQKKYLHCAPDFSYSIVCEPHRHIFIYKGAYESASGLKNRNSSEKISIGQQKLVTMDDTDEVVGLVCENEVTMLLTQSQILCLQIKS